MASRLSQKRLPETVKRLIRQELQKKQKDTLNQIDKYLNKVDVSSSEPEQARALAFERQMRSFETLDAKRDKRMRIAFYITGIVLGADLGVFIPALISAIEKGDYQSPIFWFSFLILLFSLLIMWLTFDVKYIGG